ncbi:hypothetical protein [Streptomyces sp. CAU 1734]|uniref:hypothetical protein n=1 Tax=Streptomyces sp. CAU 1734 TaxID=3140360 RepID=UPI003261922A
MTRLQTAPVLPLHGNRPPAALLLGAWLRHRRLSAGIGPAQAACGLARGIGQLERIELGHTPVSIQRALALAARCGITSEREHRVVAALAGHCGAVVSDDDPGAAERLTALEGMAVRAEIVAPGMVWPSPIAGGDRAGPAGRGRLPRPWPAGRVTLVLADLLLERSPHCPRQTAHRLAVLAARAEADVVDVRIAPVRALELGLLGRALGALGSRLTLPGSRTVYVTEAHAPVYRAPDPVLREAVDGVLAVTAGGRDAVGALRTAAQLHAATQCQWATTEGPAGCGCPAAPVGALDGRAAGEVFAVVRRGEDVLAVRGADGLLRLPSAEICGRESVSQTAVRAVFDRTGYAAVATVHLSSPAHAAGYVLCAVPGPQHEPGPPGVWARADRVPGLPPVPSPIPYDHHEAGDRT